MPLRNTCEHHVGRLIEIRIEAGYRDLADVTDIFSKIVTLGASIPDSQPLILATDWRKCTVMHEDAAQQLSSSMRGTNARIERSGALLPVQSPIAMMQLMRLLRESKNPARRGFTDPRALVAWLTQYLTAEEVERLRAFVA